MAQQHNHQGHQQHQHQGHQQHNNWLPSEGGQGAFAALQEIVTQLQADPDTD